MYFHRLLLVKLLLMFVFWGVLTYLVLKELGLPPWSQNGFFPQHNAGTEILAFHFLDDIIETLMVMGLCCPLMHLDYWPEVFLSKPHSGCLQQLPLLIVEQPCGGVFGTHHPCKPPLLWCYLSSQRRHVAVVQVLQSCVTFPDTRHCCPRCLYPTFSRLLMCIWKNQFNYLLVYSQFWPPSEVAN